jgi:exodeoxyribonuclease VII small subunit
MPVSSSRRLPGLAPVRLNPLTTIAVSRFEMTKTSSRTKAAAPDGTELSYEQALDELERMVAAMEGQQLPLDQLLHSYKRGAELLALCRGRLQAVEQQVKLLDGAELKAWEGPES